jgi:hypothetical protein
VGQQTVPFKNIDELIAPAIDLEKSGTTISKVGDSVTYTYTVTNTGNVSLGNVVIKDDAGTPGNTADDFQLTTPSSGDANTNGILEETETWIFTKTLTVPAGASDPFVNTATVNANAVNSLLTATDTDTHSVDLFKPGVTVTKAIVGNPTSALIGDTITYRITITNTSDGDLTTVALDDPNNNTPDLEVATVTDALLDAVLPSGGKVKDLAIAAGLGTLDFGETGSFDVTYTITAGDFPTLTNTVAVLYHPASFPNDVTDDDSVSITVDIPHVPGRMTGGGSIFTTSAANIGAGVRVTHGFQLHCTVDANNRLEVNWGKPNQHFHLSNLTEVACMDHPFIVQAPPDAPIDTLIGKGVGNYSGTYKGKKYSRAAAEITFIFIDAGEPGGTNGTAPHDSASYIITVLNGPGTVDDVIVLNTGDNNGVRNANDLLLATTGQIDLTFGNHQAHNELKNLLSQEAQQIQNKIDQTLAALDNVSLTEDRLLSLTSDLNSLFAQLEAAIKASA